GMGETWFCDPELFIDEELSLEEGAVIPWSGSSYFRNVLENVAAHYGIDMTVPFKKLPAKAKKIIIDGSGGEDIVYKRERNGTTITHRDEHRGVAAILTEWYTETDSPPIREKLAQFMRTAVCPVCKGARLRKEALSVLIEGKSIYGAASMSALKA